MKIEGHSIDKLVEEILDHLGKLPDVRFVSSEEREKYDESIKAVDDYYSGLYGSYIEGEEKGIAKENLDPAYRLASLRRCEERGLGAGGRSRR